MKLIKKNTGFTLIELIITVAILGIIAAVAFPAYDRYKRKGYRMDAISYLTKAAAFQESWLVDNGSYTPNLGNLGGATTDKDHYSLIATTASGGSTFLITATAKGAQTSDTDCIVYTIDNVGRHVAKKSDTTDNSKKCWGN